MAMLEILQNIRGYAAAGRVVIIDHAWQRMEERGATQEDVLFALRTAHACSQQANGRWKVFGSDLDGVDMTVIVEMQSDLIVVTMY